MIEPEPDDARTLAQRFVDTATAIGVSRRKLERQVARLVELGPAGLVDARMLQEVRRAVDVRWDGVCLQVLASYTNQSNPTKLTVIRRTNKEFQRQVPDGKVPSLSVAYRRLEALDHGRYKGRRSGKTACRPTPGCGTARPVWPDHWRCPLSLVCPEHRTYLPDSCPGCKQRPHATPAWLTHPVELHHCPSRVHQHDAGRGRRRMPWCDTDLSTAPTVPAPPDQVAEQRLTSKSAQRPKDIANLVRSGVDRDDKRHDSGSHASRQSSHQPPAKGARREMHDTEGGNGR